MSRSAGVAQTSLRNEMSKINSPITKPKNEDRLMKVKFMGLVAAGLLVGSMAANAGLVVTTTIETATDLTGTFAITSEPGGAPFSTPEFSTFGSLFPDGHAHKQLVGRRGTLSGKDSAVFGTRIIGSPDSPIVEIIFSGVAQTFASYGGMYNNNVNPAPRSQPTNVYFLFSNLADTGGVLGTFSGSFCFSAVENRCSSTVSTPAPGALMLLGAGLAGLGFARRRRNQPQA